MHPARYQESSRASVGAGERLDRLITALRDPACFSEAGHAPERVELLQTHISCVLLAGKYAYKIKKPVNLGFLDFGTLAARRHYCEEELRLNRRTAPDLYLEVIAIGGSECAPVIGGGGPAIEYALRMRRFEQDDLLERMANRGALAPAHVDALARALAAFHGEIRRAGTDDAYGSPAQVLAPALQNFGQMLPLVSAKADIARLARLRDWSAREHAQLAPVFAARKRDGWVRECHGDLHLGNIALLSGVPTPFDCIEFNAELRWIDVMNEIAFMVMDLFDHRLPRLAMRFLNAYLEYTGDYAGLRVLRYYLVYRALVRAKVACLRSQQSGVAASEKSAVGQAYHRHLRLAEQLCSRAHPALLLMHGLSGSGKTTNSQSLLEALGAVRLRSDVERKRLFGVAAGARSGTGIDTGLYAPEASERTYARLRQLARSVIAAGYPLIVDAAFLKRTQRDLFAGLARETGAEFLIAACSAPAGALRARVSAREGEALDASDAGLAVLEHQFAHAEALAPDELAHAMSIDAERGAGAPEAAAIARRMNLEFA